MQLFLIRHPRPVMATGLCYGRSDLTLDEDAAGAAAALRSLLPESVPVFSSPLTRCRLLAEELHPAPHFDERLMELDFGDWELRTWEDIGRPAIDAWAANPLMFAAPRGESMAALRTRVSAFLADLTGSGMEKAVLVVHAGVMKVCAAELLGLSTAEWFPMKFEFATATLIERQDEPSAIPEADEFAAQQLHGGGWRLVWHNRRDG